MLWGCRVSNRYGQIIFNYYKRGRESHRASITHLIVHRVQSLKKQVGPKLGD